MGGSKKLLGRGPGLAHVSWSIPVFKLFFEDVGMACRMVQPSQYEHLCHPPLQCIICLCLYDVGWLAYALYFLAREILDPDRLEINVQLFGWMWEHSV